MFCPLKFFGTAIEGSLLCQKIGVGTPKFPLPTSLLGRADKPKRMEGMHFEFYGVARGPRLLGTFL